MAANAVCDQCGAEIMVLQWQVLYRAHGDTSGYMPPKLPWGTDRVFCSPICISIYYAEDGE